MALPRDHRIGEPGAAGRPTTIGCPWRAVKHCGHAVPGACQGARSMVVDGKTLKKYNKNAFGGWTEQAGFNKRQVAVWRM